MHVCCSLAWNNPAEPGVLLDFARPLSREGKDKKYQAVDSSDVINAPYLFKCHITHGITRLHDLSLRLLRIFCCCCSRRAKAFIRLVHIISKTQGH